jgi:hypothetical protein
MSRRVKPNTNASRRTDVNTKQMNKKHDFFTDSQPLSLLIQMAKAE